MFFAIFLELYSNSSYNKGQGVSAIIRYITGVLIQITYAYLLIQNTLRHDRTIAFHQIFSANSQLS